MSFQCYVTGVSVSEEEHEEVLRDQDDLTDQQQERYIEILGLTHLIDAKRNPQCFGPEGEVVISIPVHEQALDHMFLAPVSATT